MKYTLRYTKPAPDSDYGWEHASLPIGCGWFGANIFGGAGRERIQITENSLQNPGELGGLNNFAELYLHFGHGQTDMYERGLSLDDAVAYTCYSSEGTEYRREYFASYPDRVLAVHLTANKPFSVTAELVIPYIKPYAKVPGDGGGKSGHVIYHGNRARLSGRMEYFNIRFAGELVVETDGQAAADKTGLSVKNAKEVLFLMAVGTNYELEPRVFSEEDPQKKLRDFDPAERVTEVVNAALSKGYKELLTRHLADYRSLFGRVTLELGEERSEPTDRLLARYRRGEKIPYLEALYFEYGRYLLISSSRKGALPANLQGVWNVHDQSPWGSGYWHNINVQMNYWPAFSTNLAECFEAYADFNEAFRSKAKKLAEEYIKRTAPEKFEEGHCGWTVGTSVYPYSVEGPGGHSGPGTGGLTTKLFWDWYDFTRDEQVLADRVYPALRGMSEFLTKTVRCGKDGIYRAVFSASPEQMVRPGPFKERIHYHTAGCAFDQEMLFENGRDFLQAAELLDKTVDPVYETQKAQQEHYAPLRIGRSGQIKEFEEEELYGEIGEYLHRHISQLVALYPGSQIGRDTPELLDAAVITLQERGDLSTGWALAHRLCAWARTGDGEHAYKLLRTLIAKRTMDNLWDFHPPFQIDGNFGGTAGMAEMLLQSHEGVIRILPALPKAWKNGRFRGLTARGAFEVEAVWENGSVCEVTVTSLRGGRCLLSCPGIGESIVIDTEAGKSYSLIATGFVLTKDPPMRSIRKIERGEAPGKKLRRRLKRFKAHWEAFFWYAAMDLGILIGRIRKGSRR